MGLFPPAPPSADNSNAEASFHIQIQAGNACKPSTTIRRHNIDRDTDNNSTASEASLVESKAYRESDIESCALTFFRKSVIER